MPFAVFVNKGNMSKVPVISIIVPVYNGGKTLRKCMSALLRQDYPRDRYEVIVVDDGSVDNTAAIARQYADKVVENKNNLGLSRARFAGIGCAEGQIVVHTDADVLFKKDTLRKIADFFDENKDVDALTGILSAEHPNPDFFSQYKNLYMHYIFSKLPEKIYFLYGSIYATRKNVAYDYKPGFNVGEDTAYGQELSVRKRSIRFVRGIEVVHLKRYNMLSFVMNDFRVPFAWVQIFMKYKGWRQLWKGGTGYAHSSKKQHLSLVVVLLCVIMCVDFIFTGKLGLAAPLFLAFWVALNFRLFAFLLRQKGFVFCLCSVAVTFFDNMIMSMGIIFGVCKYLRNKMSAKG